MKKSAEVIRQSYSDASLILEYGTGGSTFFASKMGKKVIAVESSIKWLMELMASYKEQDHQGDIIPVWIDLGETKDWGYPVDDTRWRHWPSYSIKPWVFCSEHRLDPDLVLIDGRFRVACFIATCINVRKSVRIIWDDYVERDHYHIVQDIADPVEIVENRMATFDIKSGLIDSQKLLQLLPYFSDAR